MRGPREREQKRHRDPALGRLAGIALTAATALASGCFSRQYRSGPRLAFAGGDPVVQMTSEENMESVDHASMVPLESHSRMPDDDERVLGIVVDGQARAYPIGLLDRFESVNDSADETPFVVVRCGLTDVSAAFDRRVGGRTLTFEATGALWRDTLVIRDRATGSLWSAATGRAIAGPLEGEVLRGLPASVSRAGRWDGVHPGSLYLDLGRATSPPLKMKIYRLSPMTGVSGVKTTDPRYRPKEELLVLESGVVPGDAEALAFTASEIERRECVETSLGGRSILVRWDAALAAPRAFRDGAEVQLVPMYWFAVAEHFDRIETLGP
jgi:hypothetical protein